jgi:hypothetical protein
MTFLGKRQQKFELVDQTDPLTNSNE